MNFIGHVAVALWDSEDPEFILGAMLPDLANMAGLRLPRELREGPLKRGVSHHHQTDEHFHSESTFTDLTQSTLDRLQGLGVPRGSARAAAHVGVEMLLDGELVREVHVQDAYASALTQLPTVRSLFATSLEQARWLALEQRLCSHGMPHDYRDTDTVVLRLTHIFRARPRLALSRESEQIIRSTLPDVQRHVVDKAPLLLARLRLKSMNGTATRTTLF